MPRLQEKDRACQDPSPPQERHFRRLDEGQQMHHTPLLPARAFTETQYVGEPVKEKPPAFGGGAGNSSWNLRPAGRGMCNSFLHKTHHQGRVGCHSVGADHQESPTKAWHMPKAAAGPHRGLPLKTLLYEPLNQATSHGSHLRGKDKGLRNPSKVQTRS